LKMDFVNDMKDNFLRINYTESNLFEINMLTENKIPHFLPVEKRNINGEKYLYYKITGRQTLESILTERRLDKEWFDNIIQSIDSAINSAEDYFLAVAGICLSPDKMFWNYEEQVVEFVYGPIENAQNITMIELGEFFIEHVDYNDSDVVSAVQRFYNQALDNSIILESFLMKESNMSYQAEIPVCLPEPEIMEEIIPKQERPIKRNRPKTIACIMILSLSIFAITVMVTILYKKIFIPGIVLAFIGFLGCIYMKQKTTEDETSFAETDESGKYPIENSLDDMMTKRCGSSEKTVYMEMTSQAKQKLYGTMDYRKYKFELSHLPCTIGKDASLVSHVVEDASVSRMHAKFYEDGGVVWMQDLNSTNGTYHNGMKLSPNQKVQLETEDEVAFGRVSFVYL